jgi:hypothetical protein
MLKMMEAVFGKDMMKQADKEALELFRRLAGNQPADVSDGSEDGDGGNGDNNGVDNGCAPKRPKTSDKAPGSNKQPQTPKPKTPAAPKVPKPKATKPGK